MLRKIGLAVLPFILAGCATKNVDYPRATIFPHSEQQKMQAAEHWNALAKHEAGLIAEKLPASALLHVSCVANSCGPMGKHSSPFSKAYGRMLESHLLNAGVAVAPEYESSAHTLEYHVQTVKHRDRDGLPANAGIYSATAAASYVIYNAIDNWSNPGLIVAPIVVGADLLNYFRNETDIEKTEVIITTNVKKNNRLLSSGTRIYYFNAGDVDHYQNKKPGMAVTNEL